MWKIFLLMLWLAASLFGQQACFDAVLNEHGWPLPARNLQRYTSSPALVTQNGVHLEVRSIKLERSYRIILPTYVVHNRQLIVRERRYQPLSLEELRLRDKLVGYRGVLVPVVKSQGADVGLSISVRVLWIDSTGTGTLDTLYWDWPVTFPVPNWTVDRQ